jgi:hypothetical protein
VVAATQHCGRSGPSIARRPDVNGNGLRNSIKPSSARRLGPSSGSGAAKSRRRIMEIPDRTRGGVHGDRNRNVGVGGRGWIELVGGGGSPDHLRHGLRVDQSLSRERALLCHDPIGRALRSRSRGGHQGQGRRSRHSETADAARIESAQGCGSTAAKGRTIKQRSPRDTAAAQADKSSAAPNRSLTQAARAGARRLTILIARQRSRPADRIFCQRPV